VFIRGTTLVPVNGYSFNRQLSAKLL